MRRSSESADQLAPRFGSLAGVLVLVRSGRVSDAAGKATERKQGPNAAEFRFDPIVSRGSASTWTDACSDSAHRKTAGDRARGTSGYESGASGDDCLGGVQSSSAGAVG